MRVKRPRKYLYPAVDKAGATVDFLSTAKRHPKAALRFLRKAIGQNGAPGSKDHVKQDRTARAAAGFAGGAMIRVRHDPSLTQT